MYLVFTNYCTYVRIHIFYLYAIRIRGRKSTFFKFFKSCLVDSELKVMMEGPNSEGIDEIQVINEIKSNNDETLLQKIKHILSVVTIEPVVFLHFLAFSLIMMTQHQMIVYKTCRGESQISLLKSGQFRGHNLMIC